MRKKTISAQPTEEKNPILPVGAFPIRNRRAANQFVSIKE